MKKNLYTLLLVIGLSNAAFATTTRETIKEQMSDTRVGQVINPHETKGFYVGTCYGFGTYTYQEALYWNTFVDIHGSTKDLAISTAQTYGGSALPETLQFLLQPSKKSWDFMNQLVSVGASGTDNNLGIVSSGKDFKYLYSSSLQRTTFTVAVSRERNCVTDAGRTFCNPPTLDSCNYGTNTFQGCERNNDKTVFKKIADGKLISVRTADSVGTKTNNYSFYLPAIEQYCEWNK